MGKYLNTRIMLTVKKHKILPQKTQSPERNQEIIQCFCVFSGDKNTINLTLEMTRCAVKNILPY